MGFVISLVAIAVGAILRWAVTTEAEGVNIHSVGLIVLVLGLVGLLFSLVDYLGWWTWRLRGRTTVVREQPPTVVRERRVERVDEPR